KSNDAMAVYRDLASKRPDDPDALNDLAFTICEAGGSPDEAIKLAQTALRKAPENTGFLDTLAWAYLKKGDAGNALQILNNLVRRNPNNASFRYHLAAALAKKGDRSQARAELQTALSKRPDAVERKNIEVLLADL